MVWLFVAVEQLYSAPLSHNRFTPQPGQWVASWPFAVGIVIFGLPFIYALRFAEWRSLRVDAEEGALIILPHALLRNLPFGQRRIGFDEIASFEFQPNPALTGKANQPGQEKGDLVAVLHSGQQIRLERLPATGAKYRLRQIHEMLPG